MLNLLSLNKEVKVSSSPVDLSFPGFDETRLLPFDTPRVVFEHFEVFERASCLHVVSLKRLSNGWDTCLGLASVSTSTHANINIKHGCVSSDGQWLQDGISLPRLVEVLDERFAINCNAARACPYIGKCNGVLTLAHAPGATLRIQLWLASFLSEGPSEIKQIQPVELDEIVRTVLQRL